MQQFDHILNLDIETFSCVNLKKHGLYRYVRDPSFEILILCYSLDGKPVETIDLACGEKIPDWLVEMIKSPRVLKRAWNAMFERTGLAWYLFGPGIDLDAGSWECTMVKAGMLGLPMSLEAAGVALNTDTKKATIGKSLIRIFSIPRKPTKAQPHERILQVHEPEKWEQYKDYCAQDVYTEMAIGDKISFYVIPEKEIRLYQLDQKINDRGICADTILIKNAIHHAHEYTNSLLQEAKDITGLQNPKSVKQLKEWLELEIDETVTTLKKDAVNDLIKTAPNQTIKRVLQIRQGISKTSVKKYDALLNMLGDDNRARGMFQFIGANRTWRWSGRGFQPQNLYKNDLLDLDDLRQMEVAGKFSEIDMLWSTSDALAQLIRTSLIAPPGKLLCMSDFAAIEARVLAWLAVEMWKLDVFKTHGKIYEATGARMFNIPIEWVTKTSKYRQRAKIMELLCGYQGSRDAVLRDPKNREIGTDREIDELVDQWRDANPRIRQYWKDVENVSIHVISTGQTKTLRNLTFYMANGLFHIKLPSGRSLSYLKPILEEKIIKPKPKWIDGKLVKKEPFKKEVIFYHGVDQQTKRWVKTPTYGGKLVENIVQAISRDLLAEKMLALDELGYTIVGHVHDEVILEVDSDNCIEQVDAVMRESLPWTKGLPLAASTYTSPFYKKD